MSLLFEFITSDFASKLSMALLHTLWQGVVIAALLIVILRYIPALRSSARYWVSLLSLIALTICWPATFSIMQLEYPSEKNSIVVQQTLAEDSVVEKDVESKVKAIPENTSSINPAITVYDNFPEVQELAEVHSDIPKQRSKESDNFVVGWVIILWAIGVTGMLVRIFAQLTGVARLRRDAIDIEQRDLLDMFSELCESIGITKTIRFAGSATLVQPGVIGFWRPVLLIPAGMLTNIPPEHLQAIIAHELAHIRRYDYLVNICQMVIEAIFFFNPAVWWISRQIRIEREACCDQAGVRTTGKRIGYAQILFDAMAKSMQDPQRSVPAAFTGLSDNDTSASADRIKRIVNPKYKPHMKIGSIKLALILLLAAVAVLGIWKATDVSVNTVAKILTPQERIEKMEQIAETYSSRAKDYNENEKVTFAGKVTTIDGKPLPGYPRIRIRSYGWGGSTSSGFGIKKDGTFSHSVACRENAFLEASVDGYAPAFSEEYKTKPNQVYDNIDLVLDYGFEAKIKVVNELGEPVEGAELNKHYFYKTRGGWSGYGHTDEVYSGKDGIAVFKYCVERPVKLDVKADGYQKVEDEDYIFKPVEEEVIILRKGLVSTGVVVAKETGQPIAGAKFRLVYKGTPGHGWHLGSEDYETESDSSGKFELNQLRDNFKYSYIIEAEGYNRYVLPKIEQGNNNIKIEMIPEIVVSGKIIGDITKIDKSYCESIEKTVPAISYNMDFKEGHYENIYEGCNENEYWPVEIKDGAGYFTIRNVIGNELTLRPVGDYINGRKLTLKIDGKSIEGVVIDLDSKSVVLNAPTRPVEISFEVPEGYPTVNGKASLWYMTKEVNDSEERSWAGIDMEVIDGVGKVDFPVPAYIRLAKTDKLKGYWFDPEPWETKGHNLVEPSEKPYFRSYKAEPAGSIYGQVLDEKGNLLKYSEIKIKMVDRPKKYKNVKRFHMIESAINEGLGHRETETGKFHTVSIPLEATYVVTAKNENTYLFSDEIKLNGENPIQEVTLKQEDPETISGQLLMPDGSSADDVEVKLEIAIDLGGDARKWSNTAPSIRTDRMGRFSLEGINKHSTLTYYLRANGITGVQPLGLKAKPGSDKVYKFKKGLKLSGRVIDDETGWPIPGVWVSAESIGDKDPLTRYRNCDKVTDKNGDFVITTLNKEEYRVYMGEATIAKSSIQSQNHIRAGKDTYVEYRVKLSGWSKLVPLEPEGK